MVTVISYLFFIVFLLKYIEPFYYIAKLDNSNYCYLTENTTNDISNLKYNGSLIDNCNESDLSFPCKNNTIIYLQKNSNYKFVIEVNKTENKSLLVNTEHILKSNIGFIEGSELTLMLEKCNTEDNSYFLQSKDSKSNIKLNYLNSNLTVNNFVHPTKGFVPNVLTELPIIILSKLEHDEKAF